MLIDSLDWITTVILEKTPFTPKMPRGIWAVKLIQYHNIINFVKAKFIVLSSKCHEW